MVRKRPPEMVVGHDQDVGVTRGYEETETPVEYKRHDVCWDSRKERSVKITSGHPESGSRERERSDEGWCRGGRVGPVKVSGPELKERSTVAGTDQRDPDVPVSERNEQEVSRRKKAQPVVSQNGRKETRSGRGCGKSML